MEKRSRKRFWAIAMTAVLPTGCMLLGALAVVSGLKATFCAVLACLILPLAALCGCVGMIRSRKGKWVKGLVCFLILGVFIWLNGTILTFGHFTIHRSVMGEDAADAFFEDVSFLAMLPEKQDLGQPVSAEYHFYADQIAYFFGTQCYTLICGYDEGAYRLRKTELEENYVFQKKALRASGKTFPHRFMVADWQFHFLDMDGETYPQLSYPKYMVLIGLNDETRQIAYLYFDDDDLDYLTSAETLIEEYCGWRYIH